METREIEAFLAVAEELHFGCAAGRLGLTTSHVSQLIQGLEQRIGAVLFERTSRRVRLTPLGSNLYADLRPAYLQTRSAFDNARAAARQVAGLLRIGFTATTEGAALTRLVRAFESKYPGCRVVPWETNFFEPYEALRRDEIDVLVNWLAVDETDLTAVRRSITGNGCWLWPLPIRWLPSGRCRSKMSPTTRPGGCRRHIRGSCMTCWCRRLPRWADQSVAPSRSAPYMKHCH